MQNNLSSSSGIQTPNEFSFELDVTKINLKHTQKNKDWADLPLFLHLTFLACLLPIVCLFVICCCLSCILIKVLSVLRTFGVQLSSSLPLTSLTFAQKTQRLFFSRLKLYAFNVQCLCTVRAIETYSILIMVFSPKYKTAMNMWSLSYFIKEPFLSNRSSEKLNKQKHQITFTLVTFQLKEPQQNISRSSVTHTHTHTFDTVLGFTLTCRG